MASNGRGHVLNLKGRRFGRLYVQKRAPSPNKSSAAHWECICDCGNVVVVAGSSLLKGSTQSCGCFWQEKMRGAEGRSLRNQVLAKYKRGAKQAGRDWALPETLFDQLTQSKCHYCGIPPMITLTKVGFFGSFTYNGIDRVNNLKGYTEDNTVPCCKICNWAKSTMPYEVFLAWLDRISRKEGACWNEKATAAS